MKRIALINKCFENRLNLNYYNKVKNNNEVCKKPSIALHQETGAYKFIELDYINQSYLLNKLEGKDLHYFEVIDTPYRRLHIDFDLKTKIKITSIDRIILKELTEFLQEKFLIDEEPDYNICLKPVKGDGLYTKSIHIIISNYIMYYEDMKKLFIDYNNTKNYPSIEVDLSMYSKRKFFCLPYQSKLNSKSGVFIPIQEIHNNNNKIVDLNNFFVNANTDAYGEEFLLSYDNITSDYIEPVEYETKKEEYQLFYNDIEDFDKIPITEETLIDFLIEVLPEEIYNSKCWSSITKQLIIFDFPYKDLERWFKVSIEKNNKYTLQDNINFYEYNKNNNKLHLYKYNSITRFIKHILNKYNLNDNYRVDYYNLHNQDRTKYIIDILTRPTDMFILEGLSKFKTFERNEVILNELDEYDKVATIIYNSIVKYEKYLYLNSNKEDRTQTEINILDDINICYTETGYIFEYTNLFNTPSKYHYDTITNIMIEYNEGYEPKFYNYQVDITYNRIYTTPNYKNIDVDDMKIEAVKYIPDSNEDLLFKKLLVVKAKWGAGKSYYIMNSTIKKAVKNKLRVLIPTENNALNKETLDKKLKQIDIDSLNAVSHLDKNFNKGQETADVVICSLESFEKLKGDFDIVILDEGTSILNHFSSDTLDKRPNMRANIANKFTEILQYAKSILFLDADIMTDRINIIEDVAKVKAEYYYMINDNWKDTFINIYEKKHNNIFTTLLTERCKTDDNILIPTGSKNKSDALYKKFKTEITNKEDNYKKNVMLINSDGVKILLMSLPSFFEDSNIHNEEIPNNEPIIDKINDVYEVNIDKKIIMSNLDKYTDKYDINILIYTPSIKTGISLDTDRFNKVFSYPSSYSCVVREYIQMLFRGRQVKKIYIQLEEDLYFLDKRLLYTMDKIKNITTKTLLDKYADIFDIDLTKHKLLSKLLENTNMKKEGLLYNIITTNDLEKTRNKIYANELIARLKNIHQLKVFVYQPNPFKIVKCGLPDYLLTSIIKQANKDKKELFTEAELYNKKDYEEITEFYKDVKEKQKRNKQLSDTEQIFYNSINWTSKNKTKLFLDCNILQRKDEYTYYKKNKILFGNGYITEGYKELNDEKTEDIIITSSDYIPIFYNNLSVETLYFNGMIRTTHNNIVKYLDTYDRYKQFKTYDLKGNIEAIKIDDNIKNQNDIIDINKDDKLNNIIKILIGMNDIFNYQLGDYKRIEGDDLNEILTNNKDEIIKLFIHSLDYLDIDEKSKKIKSTGDTIEKTKVIIKLYKNPIIILTKIYNSFSQKLGYTIRRYTTNNKQNHKVNCILISMTKPHRRGFITNRYNDINDIHTNIISIQEHKNKYKILSPFYNNITDINIKKSTKELTYNINKEKATTIKLFPIMSNWCKLENSKNNDTTQYRYKQKRGATYDFVNDNWIKSKRIIYKSYYIPQIKIIQYDLDNKQTDTKTIIEMFKDDTLKTSLFNNVLDELINNMNVLLYPRVNNTKINTEQIETDYLHTNGVKKSCMKIDYIFSKIDYYNNYKCNKSYDYDRVLDIGGG